MRASGQGSLPTARCSPGQKAHECRAIGAREAARSQRAGEVPRPAPCGSQAGRQARGSALAGKEEAVELPCVPRNRRLAARLAVLSPDPSLVPSETTRFRLPNPVSRSARTGLPSAQSRKRTCPPWRVPCLITTRFVVIDRFAPAAEVKTRPRINADHHANTGSRTAAPGGAWPRGPGKIPRFFQAENDRLRGAGRAVPCTAAGQQRSTR